VIVVLIADFGFGVPVIKFGVTSDFLAKFGDS
jgi:hypothetical protein